MAAPAELTQLIYEIRGQRVILDADLAKLYGVPTFRFNEAIKRNRHRFPPDFMFQLTRIELRSLKSQFVISKPTNSSQFAMSSGKYQGAAYRPYAFTEHGALTSGQCAAEPSSSSDVSVRDPCFRQNAQANCDECRDPEATRRNRQNASPTRLRSTGRLQETATAAKGTSGFTAETDRLPSVTSQLLNASTTQLLSFFFLLHNS